jgi:hypothetical protein
MFAPSRLIEEGRTRRHDTWSAGCGGRDGIARARHCRAASSWSWGCERLIRAGRAALLRTAKACGSGTRGWCQAGGGCSNPTGFDRLSIRQRRRPKEFGSGKSAPYAVKPLRREGRMLSAGPVCSCAHFSVPLHTGPRVQRAPGLPCALVTKRAEQPRTTRARRAARTRWHIRLSRPDMISADNHPDLSLVATVSPCGISRRLPRQP